jgi:hypothetical protein
VLISRVFGSYISSEAVVRTTVILYIYLEVTTMSGGSEESSSI